MRTPVPAALAALVLGISVLISPVLLGEDHAAQAAATISVEINPSTVQAGGQVSLRASCTDNSRTATVTATPFGQVTVAPKFGFLTANATVAATTRAGDYPVNLRCPEGKTASTTLHVLAKVQPNRGPATGGGGMAPGRNTRLLLGTGLAVLVVAAAIGALTLRRRRAG